MRPERVLGLMLSCAYLLLAGGLIASDFGCEGMFCGLGLPIAALPWTYFFLELDAPLLIYLTSAAGIALNVVFLYLLPGLLARAFKPEGGPPR